MKKYKLVFDIVGWPILALVCSLIFTDVVVIRHYGLWYSVAVFPWMPALFRSFYVMFRQKA